MAWVQRLPEECDSRVMDRAYLRMGLLGSRRVHTGRLAAYIPIAIKKLSIERRLERFVENGAVRVRRWYAPIARWLVRAASGRGEIGLVWDSTKVSAGAASGSA